MIGKKSKFYVLMSIAVILLFYNLPVTAQGTNIGLRLMRGQLLIPFSSWTDHYSAFGSSHTNLPQHYNGMSFVYTVLKYHSIIVSAEFFGVLGTAYFDPIRRLEGDEDMENIRIEWEFDAIPLSIDYRYKIPHPYKNIFPFIEFGGSYIFTETQSDDFVFENQFNSTYVGQRWIEENGMIALQAALGAHYQGNEKIAAYARLRYRYTLDVEVSAFLVQTPRSLLQMGDIPYDFSGFDFALGVEITY